MHLYHFFFVAFFLTAFFFTAFFAPQRVPHAIITTPFFDLLLFGRASPGSLFARGFHPSQTQRSRTSRRSIKGIIFPVKKKLFFMSQRLSKHATFTRKETA
jgi:hypothetical protein